MNPGTLRQKARLQSPTATNADGEVTHSWTTEATRRVKYTPLTGRERWFAGQADSQATGRITMRYYAGMKTSWRIVLLDENGEPERTLHIDSIRDPEERKRYLEVMVIETDEPGSGSSP